MTSEETLTASTGSPKPSDVRANVQDVLPLLPNQLALILLRDLSAGDPGFLQVRYRLEGPLDVELYGQAWRAAISMHPALRSSIRNRDTGDPMVIVWKKVDLAIDIEDWRGELQDDLMGQLLQSDRTRGLDLTAEPTMRLHLVQTHDQEFEAIWTCHHLFIDGWSAAIVLEDVMSLYRSALGLDAPPLTPPVDSLRSYVLWAASQDVNALRRYWGSELSGYDGAAKLGLGASVPTQGFSELTVEIEDDLSAQIWRIASEMRVTPAVILQAAWALVLCTLTGGDDVTFGTTVSGRNAAVEAMERLVGYFSNAVPLRVTIDRSEGLNSWLAGLRDRQFEMGPYEQASLADIQSWSDVPGHRSMFESFVVVENFPVEDEVSGGVVQRGFRSGLTTAYPITVAIGMARPWFIHLRFDLEHCSDEAATALVQQLIGVLTAIVDDATGSIGSVIDRAGDAVSHLHEPAGGDTSRVAHAGKPSLTDTQRRVAAIWRQHLDLDDVSVDASFFDLGGTSLGAVRMFSSFREDLEIDLPLSTLLTHPTIEGIAGIIDGVVDGDAAEWTCLVPIQPNGEKPPIAAVHGGGGEVLFYRELAEMLGPDQPLYGLQPVGLDGVTEPLDSVPTMAATYIRELQQLQPTGPYRLIGFCFGGTVCLEMAAQLEASGNVVDFIGIIDGGLPIDAARYDTALERVRYIVETRGFTGMAQAGWRRVSWLADAWLRNSVGRLRGEERVDYVPVAVACRHAFVSFEPRRTSAPITLIRSAEKQVGEGRDWDFAWGDYTSRLEVATVDADHTTLFEGPAVKDLADIIARSTTD